MFTYPKCVTSGSPMNIRFFLGFLGSATQGRNSCKISAPPVDKYAFYRLFTGQKMGSNLRRGSAPMRPGELKFSS